VEEKEGLAIDCGWKRCRDLCWRGVGRGRWFGYSRMVVVWWSVRGWADPPELGNVVRGLS
jgi:hypothetical protein